MLRVSPGAGRPAVAPAVESAMSGEYPLARPLLLLTLGERAIRAFLDWVRSPAGQAIVRECGYVPIRAAESAAVAAGH